ncbi:MAG: hypothetical protein ACI8V5_002850 [Limisphaerales bacterium]|jgi:hypothetical protein
MDMSRQTAVLNKIKHLVAAMGVGVFASASLAAQATSDKSAIAFFDSKVHPILEENCYRCHGAKDKLKGGLRLTSRNGLVEGGDSGSAINPGSLAESVFLQMLSYKDEHHEMPPDGKLPAEQIDILTKWVEMGAPFNPVREISGKAHKSAYNNKINDESRNYWAFRPVGQPQPPKVDNAAWSANPIDAYLYAELAAKGLKPNPPASRRALIRRAYYDLIGLPPTPAEVKAFENDRSPKAFGKIVDHLLTRPQYGEKWGRHWLDLVRYAETNGYERDNPKPEVWRYRDYVIRALNQDKPYDRFVREQLAGDEFTEPTADGIIATGFQRLGIWDDEPVDADQAYFDSLDDVVSVSGQAFLGLTIGCCRCHDHKIDPLPQADYYRMTAFFNNTFNNSQQRKFKKSTFTLNTTTVIASPAARAEHDRRVRALREEMKERSTKLEGFEKRIFATFSNPEKEDAADKRTRELLMKQKSREALGPKERKKYIELKKEFESLKARKAPPLARALAIKENGPTAPEAFVLIRGNAHVPGDKVVPGFPQVLGLKDPVIPTPPKGAQSSGRRTVLADWIVSKDNPLTARVMANRIWQFHFGRGIVRSPSNFGQNGVAPTHPKLLDWLARDFMNQGWSIKKMHRRMMLSKAYQMSSAANEAALKADPQNNLFWRFDMRRLTAEEIRDSIINLTGKLNLKQGGPSIYTEMPAEVLATASRPDKAWGTSSETERNRRSVYVHIKRSLNEPMLKAFDQADSDSPCAVRFATTVPTQSLTMLNSKLVNDSAEDLGDRLRATSKDPREQVRTGLSLAFCRDATNDEIKAGLALIDELQTDAELDQKHALDRFCLMVLNLNEFVYLD